MASNELARAYITIVPSMEGSRGTITEALTGEADSAGSQAGSRAGAAFGSALGVAAQVGAAAVTAAAAGVTAITTQAVNAYADYEQLTGGIETLYGEASAQMMQYAAEAATTTGQSMNEFMESAISTSAAMISAVEGDQARAAQLTNQAMIDMADNANKLGTDMESIQNAYRGFSRGNFTMLDNLALGYAGTREGMQQLLDDARAISGIDYDIDSYADIVEAIHTVQEEMGIAGTTATEASETITGSLGSLSASWENLITNIANPDADLGALIDNLVTNAETALTNLVPVISQALTGLSDVIVSLAPVIAAELPVLIQNIVPPLLSAAGSIIQALGEGLILALPAIGPVAVDLIIGLVNFLVSNLGNLVEAALQIVIALANGLADALPELIPACTEAIVQICLALTDPDVLPQLLVAAERIIQALMEGLIAAIPQLLSAVPEIMSQLNDSIAISCQELANNAIGWGMDMVNGFVQGMMDSLGSVASAAGSIASSVASYLHHTTPDVGPLANDDEWGYHLVDNFINGIENGSPELEATLNRTLSVPGILSQDLSDGYVNTFSNGDSGNLMIPVYIGQEQLDTIMIRSEQMAMYRRGG